MKRTLLLSATLLSLASAPLAYAQQPDPAPSPAASQAAPIIRATPPPRDPGARQDHPPQRMIMSRDIQIIAPGGRGNQSRIAPPGIWWKNPDLVQKLNITPDQQARMDGIFQQSRIQLIDLKANVEKQDVILEPMLDANPPDTNKVLTQIDKTAQARAELEKANARMLLGVRAVLTPDQWSRLQAEQRSNRHTIIIRKGGPEGSEGITPARGPRLEGHGPSASLEDLDIDIDLGPDTPAPAL